ncbi:MAG TPA: MoxR family ATPase [Rhodocyclaceae bacterium]|nr:MoxR family ATPase [Rhodocyclaceae bacterium]HND25619.1 MoxR family ATPase [Rhodocyclaceae bacterium]
MNSEKPDLPVNVPLDLAPIGSWPATRHVFDPLSADAIAMAWAAQRPLLVRGEPGTGKSQLARAVAQTLGRVFIAEVVHARTEPQDLLWRFDTVARLGEAQAAAGRLSGPDQPDPLDPQRFLSPGPLWWAFDWERADECFRQSRHRGNRPPQPAGWTPDRGCVLLIDEIDKAESDVPNSLLEVLGNRSFAVPWSNTVVGQASNCALPLVIITTNEERELPAAFLRRCLVLQYDLPADLVPWLIDRGAIHFPTCAREVLETAANQLVQDRADAREAGVTPPGQAEYLDLLRAVTTLAGMPGEQLELLAHLSHFAYRKFRDGEARA